MSRPGGRVVVAVVADMFFAVRIQEAARAAGVTLIQCPAGGALELCSAERPDLVIVDLHGPGDPLGMVRDLKRVSALAGLRMVGFYSHVDQETKRAAEAAGVDQVLPRSAFSARLAELLAGGAPRALYSAPSHPPHDDPGSLATMNPDLTNQPDSATERVRISCPGCGRGDYVSWPVGQPTYHWKCFNCHKEFDLSRKAGH